MLRGVASGNAVLHSPPECRDEDKCVIILLSGLSGTKESMKSKGKALAQAGHGVILADHYNEGERRIEPLSNRQGWQISQKTYFWNAIWKTAQDVPGLIDFAIATFGTDNVAGYGESMGGDIFLTALVFERRLKAVVTEVATPDWMRPDSVENILGHDEDGDRLYRERCPCNNLDAFAEHPSAILLITGESDRHVPGACAEAFVKGLRARGHYACSQRLQHVSLPSCGSKGHAIIEDTTDRAVEFFSEMMPQKAPHVANARFAGA